VELKPYPHTRHGTCDATLSSTNVELKHKHGLPLSNEEKPLSSTNVELKPHFAC